MVGLGRCTRAGVGELKLADVLKVHRDNPFLLILNPPP